jgi:hypothetical protein
MTAKTRLGEEGYGVRRVGSFAGKTDSGPVGGPHPVGVITRLALDGYGVRRYSSFAGKTLSDQPVTTTRVVGGFFGRQYREYGPRDPRSKYLTKKRWEELLEEVRLEEGFKAPTKAKKAITAIAEAERAAVGLAEDLFEPEAEQLARTLVAAERAKTAVETFRRVNDALRQIAEIQARIEEDDEDDVLMLSLALL